MEKNKKFVIGQKMAERSSCNYNCIFEGIVLSRTNKTVTIDSDLYGPKKVKIFIDENNNEYCWPFGKYSMAPIFYS